MNYGNVKKKDNFAIINKEENYIFDGKEIELNELLEISGNDDSLLDVERVKRKHMLDCNMASLQLRKLSINVYECICFILSAIK